MLKSVNIGSLDRIISIQANAPSLAADGLPIDNWTNLYINVPAKRVWQSGAEPVEAGKETTKQSATYTIRYASGISPKCRMVEGDTYYQITSVTELGRRQGLQLEVIEIEGGA